MRIPRPIAFLPLILAVSCGSGSKPASSSTPAEAPAFKPLSQRLGESNGYQVDANGNWVPKNNKRSSFESQGRSPHFTGEYSKKDFKTQPYARKSWWGNKDFGRQTYAGSTDGSRFQKNSRFGGQGAREAGNNARLPDNYRTGNFDTGTARESGLDRLGRPADDATANRRDAYVAPEIIDWRAQRSLSVDQSRGILGR